MANFCALSGGLKVSKVLGDLVSIQLLFVSAIILKPVRVGWSVCKAKIESISDFTLSDLRELSFCGPRGPCFYTAPIRFSYHS